MVVLGNCDAKKEMVRYVKHYLSLNVTVSGKLQFDVMHSFLRPVLLLD